MYVQIYVYMERLVLNAKFGPYKTLFFSLARNKHLNRQRIKVSFFPVQCALRFLSRRSSLSIFFFFGLLFQQPTFEPYERRLWSSWEFVVPWLVSFFSKKTKINTDKNQNFNRTSIGGMRKLFAQQTVVWFEFYLHFSLQFFCIFVNG